MANDKRRTIAWHLEQIRIARERDCKYDAETHTMCIGELVEAQHLAKPERKEKMTRAKYRAIRRAQTRLLVTRQKIKRLEVDIAIQESSTADDKIILESLKDHEKRLRTRLKTADLIAEAECEPQYNGLEAPMVGSMHSSNSERYEDQLNLRGWKHGESEAPSHLEDRDILTHKQCPGQYLTVNDSSFGQRTNISYYGPQAKEASTSARSELSILNYYDHLEQAG